jgi:CRP/FNR family transcriptional regulator, anaerobic regulatory protein
MCHIQSRTLEKYGMDWIDLFPGLARLDPTDRHELISVARKVQLPAGHIAFRVGEECRNYLLVIDGSVRVQMTSESGREIVLYRVEPGQSCVLTTVCLMASEPYSAEGIVEKPVRAIAIPAANFRGLLNRSPALRNFVFTSYGTRIANLMRVVQEIAFDRIEARVARVLLKHGGSDRTVKATHQMLAHELGTAREVISRQLKELEGRGVVRAGRGEIEICDPAALAQLAESPGERLL